MSPPPGIQIFRLEDGSRRNLLLWRMKSCVPSDFEMPQKLLHVIAQAWWEIWAKAVIWQFLQKWGGKAIILNVMCFTTWKGWIAFAMLHRPIQQKSYKERSASILIRNCLAAGCDSTLTFNATTVTSSHQYSIPSCSSERGWDVADGIILCLTPTFISDKRITLLLKLKLKNAFYYSFTLLWKHFFAIW